MLEELRTVCETHKRSSFWGLGSDYTEETCVVLTWLQFLSSNGMAIVVIVATLFFLHLFRWLEKATRKQEKSAKIEASDRPTVEYASVAEDELEGSNQRGLDIETSPIGINYVTAERAAELIGCITVQDATNFSASVQEGHYSKTSKECYKCKREGHLARDCGRPRCTNCGEFGHELRTCWRRYRIPTQAAQANFFMKEEDSALDDKIDDYGRRKIEDEPEPRKRGRPPDTQNMR